MANPGRTDHGRRFPVSVNLCPVDLYAPPIGDTFGRAGSEPGSNTRNGPEMAIEEESSIVSQWQAAMQAFECGWVTPTTTSQAQQMADMEPDRQDNVDNSSTSAETETNFVRPAEKKFQSLQSRILEYNSLLEELKLTYQSTDQLSTEDHLVASDIASCESEISRINAEIHALRATYANNRSDEDSAVLVSDSEIDAIRSFRILQPQLETAAEKIQSILAHLASSKTERLLADAESRSSLPICIELSVDAESAPLLGSERFCPELICDLSDAASVDPAAFRIVAVSPATASLEVSLAADARDAQGRSAAAAAAGLAALLQARRAGPP